VGGHVKPYTVSRSQQFLNNALGGCPGGRRSRWKFSGHVGGALQNPLHMTGRLCSLGVAMSDPQRSESQRFDPQSFGDPQRSVVHSVQGYLPHKKLPTPLGSPQVYA
jgi:hypothetical protein